MYRPTPRSNTRETAVKRSDFLRRESPIRDTEKSGRFVDVDGDGKGNRQHHNSYDYPKDLEVMANPAVLLLGTNNV